MWDVERFSAQVNFFGGVRVIDTVHVLIFIVIVFYLFVHVYLSTLGHTRTAHFRAMFTGYDDVEENEGEPAAATLESAPSGGARQA
jgi:thiosulfate reductase cytochrome b subunit